VRTDFICNEELATGGRSVIRIRKGENQKCFRLGKASCVIDRRNEERKRAKLRQRRMESKNRKADFTHLHVPCSAGARGTA
jgi:hypothetical protein